jgi:hypothetical protein
MPYVHYRAQGSTLEWKPAGYQTLHTLLTNPIYA